MEDGGLFPDRDGWQGVDRLSHRAKVGVLENSNRFRQLGPLGFYRNPRNPRLQRF